MALVALVLTPTVLSIQPATVELYNGHGVKFTIPGQARVLRLNARKRGRSKFQRLVPNPFVFEQSNMFKSKKLLEIKFYIDKWIW